MAGSPYVFEYEGRFTLPAPPTDVWAAIGQADRFETWWTWLRELQVEGVPLQSGSVMQGLVSPPVPHRMRLRVALLRCEPPSLIEADVSGDLVGRARIRFDPEPAGTRATVAWTVEMMQRSMRIAARLGSPLLRFAHDRVVEHTVARFTMLLAEESPPAGRPGTFVARRPKVY